MAMRRAAQTQAAAAEGRRPPAPSTRPSLPPLPEEVEAPAGAAEAAEPPRPAAKRLKGLKGSVAGSIEGSVAEEGPNFGLLRQRRRTPAATEAAAVGTAYAVEASTAEERWPSRSEEATTAPPQEDAAMAVPIANAAGDEDEDEDEAE